jgi:hypothetical protein
MLEIAEGAHSLSVSLYLSFLSASAAGENVGSTLSEAS